MRPSHLLTPNKGSLKTIVLRDLSWVAVTAVVLLIPRLGDTGPKCLERLAGTVLGGAAGLAAALSHSAPVATLIAALTGAGGELLGSAGGFSYAGKMVGVSYCIVAMPAFGAVGQPRDWAVDGAMVKLAVERLAAVFIGVGLVYLLSIAWLPRAASDEAFALAAEGVARLVDLSAAAMRPAAVLAHDEEEGEGGGWWRCCGTQGRPGQGHQGGLPGPHRDALPGAPGCRRRRAGGPHPGVRGRPPGRRGRARAPGRRAGRRAQGGGGWPPARAAAGRAVSWRGRWWQRGSPSPRAWGGRRGRSDRRRRRRVHRPPHAPRRPPRPPTSPAAPRVASRLFPHL